MADITVTTNQNIIAVTETGGVNVTNTTDIITVLPSGTLIIQGPDTYSINASTTTGGANLNLLNSNGTNDAVKIASGTGITVSRTDADTITVTNTSPAGTTYTQNASSTTGGANLNLVGSDSTTDSVKFASGTGITVSRTDADTITITNTVVGDVVGPASATDNALARFDTTTGKLIQNSNAILSDTGDLSITGDLTVTGTNINTGVTDSLISIDRTTTSTSNVPRALSLKSTTTGTPAVGFGTSLEFIGQTGVATFKQAGLANVSSTNITAGSETFRMDFQLMKAGATASNVLSIFGATGDVVLSRGGKLNIQGATSGGTSIGAPATGSTLTYVLPGTAGAASTVLTNDGSGNLTWTTPTPAPVSSVSGSGSGISVTPTTGAVVVSNTGVTSAVAGSGIGVSASTGAVTFSNTGVTSITGTANQIIASNSTGAITLSTPQDIATTSNPTFAGGTLGNITVGVSTDNTITTTDTNGSLTLAPNGTGNLILTLSAGGNLTNTTNYLRGTVGDATVLAAGDIYGFTNGAATSYRGALITNEDNTAKAPGIVLRGFTGGASAQPLSRPQFAFERARGTAASPTAVQSGDLLGGFSANGRTSTGWLRDISGATTFPAIMNFSATENWVSNTNVGTGWALVTTPTATTFSSPAVLQTTISANPQTMACRSDAYTWSNGKTGTTQRMSLDVSGNLVVSAGITATTGNIAASAGSITANTTITATTGNITATAGKVTTVANSIEANGAFDVNQSMSATADLLNTNFAAGSSLGIQTNYWTSSAKTTRSVPQNTWKLGNFRFNSYSDTAGTFALGAQVFGEATENWTSSANGSRIVFLANKQGQSWSTGHQAVISAAPEASTITSDTITLESSAGTDYAVLNANTAKFSVPVTTELTNATINEGTTYTPAATVNNNLNIQINALAGGTTVIDLASLTGNTRGASYNILVFNNTGTGAPIQVKNTRINTNNLMTHTITTGNRIIINAYVVGDYATATHFQIP